MQPWIDPFQPFGVSASREPFALDSTLVTDDSSLIHQTSQISHGSRTSAIAITNPAFHGPIEHGYVWVINDMERGEKPLHVLRTYHCLVLVDCTLSGSFHFFSLFFPSILALFSTVLQCNFCTCFLFFHSFYFVFSFLSILPGEEIACRTRLIIETLKDNRILSRTLC